MNETDESSQWVQWWTHHVDCNNNNHDAFTGAHTNQPLQKFFCRLKIYQKLLLFTVRNLGLLYCTICLWLSVYHKRHNWQYASNHRSPSKFACVCWCLWASTSTACISTPNMVRHDICRQNYAVERGLVIGFCGQPHYCHQPYYPTARFPSPSSYMVSWFLWAQTLNNNLDLHRANVKPECQISQMKGHLLQKFLSRVTDGQQSM